jgi:hypothetical protein
MVTLAGLEPATSPAPGEQGRSIPLELQRRHDLHDRLWRRRGGGIGSTPATTEQRDARAPHPRRRGLSNNKLPVSSCGTTTDSSLHMFISRMSQVGDKRPSC